MSLKAMNDVATSSEILSTRSRKTRKEPEPPDILMETSNTSSSSGTSNIGIDLLIRASEGLEKSSETNGRTMPMAVSVPSQKVQNKKLQTMTVIGFDVIRNMSSKKMIECFTVQHSNEMTKHHKLTCMLIPHKCQHEESSFGSEQVAEKRMILHLEEHRAQLLQELRDPSRTKVFEFSAVPVYALTASHEMRSRTSPKNGRKENMSSGKNRSKTVNSNSNPSVDSEEIASSPEVLRENTSTKKRKGKAGERKSSAKKLKMDKVPATSNTKAPRTSPQGQKKSRVNTFPQVNMVVFHDHDYTSSSGKSSSFLTYVPPQECAEIISDPGPVPILPLNIPPTNRQELPMVSEEVIIGAEPSSPAAVPSREVPVAGPCHQTNGWNSCQARASRKQGKTGQLRIARRAPAPVVDEEIKARALQYVEEMKNRPKSGKNSQSLECKICGDQFTAAASLTYHYKGHAGLKQFVCHLCHQEFTRQHSLNYHISIHTGKTRFKCASCEKKFRHPNHYKEHLRKHTGETPFECGDCTSKFKTRNTYKRHLKTRHGKILTAKGIHILSPAEFQKVKTKPYKTFHSEEDVTRKANAEKVIMKKRTKKPDSSGEPAAVPAPSKGHDFNGLVELACKLTKEMERCETEQAALASAV